MPFQTGIIERTDEVLAELQDHFEPHTDEYADISQTRHYLDQHRENLSAD